MDVAQKSFEIENDVQVSLSLCPGRSLPIVVAHPATRTPVDIIGDR